MRQSGGGCQRACCVALPPVRAGRPARPRVTACPWVPGQACLLPLGPPVRLYPAQPRAPRPGVSGGPGSFQSPSLSPWLSLILPATRHRPGQAGGGWDEQDSSPGSQSSQNGQSKASGSGSRSGSDSPSGASRAPSDLADR